MNTHRFLYFLAALPLLLTSCVKEPAAVRSYNQFVVNPPQFTSPDGSKLGWASYGLIWEPGDILVINDVAFKIYYNNSEGKWYTESLEGTGVPRMIYNGGPEGFSVVYTGADRNGIVIDESTGYYGYIAAPFDGTFYPMAGHLTTNNITLTPCCCVIRVTSSLDYTMMVNVDDADNHLVEGGVIDPVKACFVEAESDVNDGFLGGIDRYATIDPSGNVGYDYFVLPMTGSTIHLSSIQFLTDDGFYNTEVGNPDGITLRKGVVYTLDLTRTAPNAK